MKKSGFGLVELIVALAVIGTAIAAVYGAAVLAHRASRKAAEKTQAAFLLEEGMEAVRRLRDASWSDNIEQKTPGTDYCIAFSGAAVSLESSSHTQCVVSGGSTTFRRVVRFYQVCRNDNGGAIAACGEAGISDSPGTRRVVVTVSWGPSLQNIQNLEFYIANFF